MNNEFTLQLDEEDKKRLAKMLILSRAESGISQEKVALELGIAKKTVQNWERGISSPTLPQAISWFRVMRVAAMPYLIQFMFPDLEGITSSKEDNILKKDLIALIDTLPAEGIRQLMYLFFGDHGSSPRATLNLMTAHLQAPLRDRYRHANVILDDYMISAEKEQLSGPDHIKPNVDIIEKSIKLSRKSIIEDQNNYMICN